MAKAHKDLQRDYMEVLQNEISVVLDWWNSNCPYAATEPVTWDEMTDFHRRWPTGPAGHPRIIALFRRYFFKVEELNESIAPEADEPLGQGRGGWGEEIPPAQRTVVRPVDLLINDLSIVAPELFEVMQGFVFIPIGMDPDGEEC